MATTYYISSSSSSTRKLGTDSLKAWSLEMLNSAHLKAGDTILFRRGEVFVGELKLTSGLPGRHITYGAYGSGPNPIISGLVDVQGWKRFSGKIFFATLTTDNVSILTLNDKIQAIGRWPKTGYVTYTGHQQNRSISGPSISKIPFHATGAEVVIRKYRWVLDRAQINRHSDTSLEYKATNEYGNSTAYAPVNGNGYFIQNHIGCLTEEGDWYFDRLKRRLYFHFGENLPGNVRVRVGTYARNVSAIRKAHITLTNLSFEGAAAYGAYLFHSNDITFSNCTFAKQGGVAIYGMDVQNIAVNSTKVDEAINLGIFLEDKGRNIEISDCTITNIGIAGMGRSGDGSYSGIALKGDSMIVSNNRLYNIGYNGISIDGDHVLVEKNIIDTYCNIKDDGGGIYPGCSRKSPVPYSRIIRHNIVVNGIGAKNGAEGDVHKYGKATGIYLDGQQNSSVVTGNVVGHTDFNGILINQNIDNIVSHNFLYDCTVGLWISQTHEVDLTRNRIFGNSFIPRTSSQQAQYINTVLKSK